MRERCARNKVSSGAVSATPIGASPRGWSACLVAAFWLAAFGFAPPVSAETLSFSGILTRDDEIASFRFYVTTPSDATFRTLSYAGGTDADGNTIAPGGFDPVLSLFDATGNLLVFVDDGSEPDINTDSITGLALDSFFTLALSPGDYTLALSQSNNYPDNTLADPFSRQGEGNFTTTYGCGAGEFYDFSCDPRSGAFHAEVQVAVTAPVPLPASIWLLCSALGGIVGVARRVRPGMPRPGRYLIASGVGAAIVGTGVFGSPSAFASERLQGPNCGYEVRDVEEAKGLIIWTAHGWQGLDKADQYCGNDPACSLPFDGLYTYPAGRALAESALQDQITTWAKDDIILCPAPQDNGLQCDDSDAIVEDNRVSDPPGAPPRRYRRYFCQHVTQSACDSPYDPGGKYLFHARVDAYYCVAECPVKPLTPLDASDRGKPGYDSDPSHPTLGEQFPENDPDAASLTRQLEDKNGDAFGGPLSAAMNEALACLKGAINAAGGSAIEKSGYRTKAYNKHLQEVWDKWKGNEGQGGLEDNREPACGGLKNAVKKEFAKHGLKYRPAERSLHTDNPANAFDLGFSVPAGADIDAIACTCNVYRFSPTFDPGHFDHRLPIRVDQRERKLGLTPEKIRAKCPSL